MLARSGPARARVARVRRRFACGATTPKITRQRARFRMKERATDEALLLPRVARGDAEAVQACIDRYGPLVWSLAKRLTRDVSVLEDLVQEIFIAIWKNAASFD